MNRNKIERFILSQHHHNNPNLIFGLTVLASFIISGTILLVIFIK